MVGRVAAVYRYPVKSLAGETLGRVVVDGRGLQGDRWWSVRDPDGKFGSGKSSRRFRKMDGLLELSARYDGPVPVIAFPDGRELRGDDETVHAALSEHVGRPVRLASEDGVSHFDDGPVHLVTTSGLRALEAAHGRRVDVRRLRPNVVVETDGAGLVEEGWLGRRLHVGEVALAVVSAMPRCVMLDLPQVGLAADPGLLRTVTDLNDMCFGVLAEVARPGTLAAGDPVILR